MHFFLCRNRSQFHYFKTCSGYDGIWRVLKPVCCKRIDRYLKTIWHTSAKYRLHICTYRLIRCINGKYSNYLSVQWKIRFSRIYDYIISYRFKEKISNNLLEIYLLVIVISLLSFDLESCINVLDHLFIWFFLLLFRFIYFVISKKSTTKQWI